MPSEVSVEEILFRRVRDEDNHVTFVDGQYRISGQAFADKKKKPSVDLASLAAGLGGPAWTQERAENGVLRLRTGDVRALVITGKREVPPPRPPNTPKQIDVDHEIDVYPCPVVDEPPERDNPAHAEIRPNPDWCSGNVFRRLLEALVRISEIELLPLSQRK